MEDYLVLIGAAIIVTVLVAILRRFEADVLRSPWTR
jgi:hypothetical protein